MSESDRKTLLHAAELLEQEADRGWQGRAADLLATAKALREMASAAQG